MHDEATYICESCGDDRYPTRLVGWREPGIRRGLPGLLPPYVIHVEIDEDGDARVWAAGEQNGE